MPIAQVCTVRTRWAGSGEGRREGRAALDFGCALNTRLPLDIGVRHAEQVGMGWAPFRCARKRYRYLISAAALEEDLAGDHDGAAMVADGSQGKRKKGRRHQHASRPTPPAAGQLCDTQNTKDRRETPKWSRERPD